MMRRSVISSPPIDTAAAAGMPLMRTPSSSTSSSSVAAVAGAGAVDVMMAQCNNSPLTRPAGLTGPTLMTRPMTLTGPVAAAIHPSQNSTDTGLGQFVHLPFYYYSAQHRVLSDSAISNPAGVRLGRI